MAVGPSGGFIKKAFGGAVGAAKAAGVSKPNPSGQPMMSRPPGKAKGLFKKAKNPNSRFGR